ncbi:hypothetical protein CVH10_20750, partial [Halomonas sp. ND22Bw]
RPPARGARRRRSGAPVPPFRRRRAPDPPRRLARGRDPHRPACRPGRSAGRAQWRRTRRDNTGGGAAVTRYSRSASSLRTGRCAVPDLGDQ